MTVVEEKVKANRDLIVGGIEAAQAGDIEGFMAILHPEVEVFEPDYLPYGGTYHGRDGFLELFGKATAVIDFPTLEVISATADEERTVLLMKCKLASNGEETFITEHWTIEDGLVVEVRVFWFDLPA